MALFGKKTKVDTKETKPAVVKKAAVRASAPRAAVMHSGLNHVILGARVTEKAARSQESGTYVFNVGPEATKKTIAETIAALYKVTPVSVNIVNTPRKQIFSRGKMGMKKGGKKAYVYLKKGDKIEII